MIELCVKNGYNIDIKRVGQFVKVMMTKEEFDEETSEKTIENNLNERCAKVNEFYQMYILCEKIQNNF